MEKGCILDILVCHHFPTLTTRTHATGHGGASIFTHVVAYHDELSIQVRDGHKGRDESLI